MEKKKKTNDLNIQARMPKSEGQELLESEGQGMGAEKRAERIAGPLGRPRGENKEANHKGMGRGEEIGTRETYGDERPRTPCPRREPSGEGDEIEKKTAEQI